MQNEAVRFLQPPTAPTGHGEELAINQSYIKLR